MPRSAILGLLYFVCVPAVATPARADGPADNDPLNVRAIPRIGIDLPRRQRADFDDRLNELKGMIDALQKRDDRRTRTLLPDVEIFYRAVKTNVEHHELFSQRDVVHAGELLRKGRERARQLLARRPEWTQKTGLVVHGYRSRIDGTVQPYGLVVPESYSPHDRRGFRLDVWFHGRGETLSETNFIHERTSRPGRYSPRNTIVLHPYGRYSNAFKFAGEVDVLEALEDVQRRYNIDEDRISVRGFSMGGAACWQFAVHYPDRWFAANPGAGFSETPAFLRTFQQESLSPRWYERQLWSLYDCPGYAINLYHCPTVAYSGELDSQKQAADVMDEALKRVGIDLLHVVGPKTKHAIHRDSMKEIEHRMNELAKAGRDRNPRRIKFATYTLKYNRAHWLTIESLEEHWRKSEVAADVFSRNRISLTTNNVNGLKIDVQPGSNLLDVRSPVEITIDGEKLTGPRPKSDRSFQVQLHRGRRGWRLGESRYRGLRKEHNLQGPIDDAFMDSFVFVKPDGRASNRRVGRWTQSELDRAIDHWRRQFRGDARVKSPKEIEWTDISRSNLVLFGDPSSNSVIAKIADKLPIQWTSREIIVGKRTYDADNHALIMVYPNPYNPEKYVVLNSGFTYREYAYLNNARQVPMLPDWAVVDLRTPPGTQRPGRIADAGFFGEYWELKRPSLDW